MTKKLVVLGILLLATAASSAEAQRSQRGSRPIEFGIDGGVSFLFASPTITLVALPVQDFRIGLLMTNEVAIEPRAHINSIRGDGGSITTYGFEMGLVYSPSGDRVGRGFYGRPFLGVLGVTVSGPGDNDDSDGYAGLGLGLKIPFANRRLATRMETNFSHGFSGGGSGQLGVLIGLSFFTR